MNGMFFEVNTGDILVARLGPTILNQKIVKVNSTCRRTLASAEFLVLRCKNKDIADKVICVVRTAYYMNIMYLHSRGSTPSRYRLCREDMLTLPFPDLDKIKSNFVDLMNAAAQSRCEKLQQADALLAGMSDFVCAALKISLPTATLKLGVGVTIRQLKADKAFNVDYYHAERTTTIAAVEAVPHKRLGDCVCFMRDIVSANNGKYLGLAGVQSNTGELSGAEDEATGQAFVFRTNDVLYCRLRPYLNKVWEAEYDGVCSTEFHVLRVKCNNVLPEYLAAVMRSTLVLNQSRHMMTGNTHPRITNADVANLLIPVPDMHIQQKIADEMQIRRDTARTLRMEAETEWSTAKAQFEKELLGETEK